MKKEGQENVKAKQPAGFIQTETWTDFDMLTFSVVTFTQLTAFFSRLINTWLILN